MTTSLRDSFLATYESIAGIGHAAASPAEVAAVVAEVLDGMEARRVAVALVADEVRDAIEAVCRERSIELLTPPFPSESLPHALDDVQLGITGIAFAIAESGTLVEVVTDDAHRLVSSLPRTHIGIVPANEIVATLRDAAPRLRDIFSAHDRNVVVSFISGPSRTGDIEMILTLGVHGPEKAHAILYGDG